MEESELEILLFAFHAESPTILLCSISGGRIYHMFEDFFLSGCCVQSDDSESENNQCTLLLHLRKGVVGGLG